LKKEIIKKSAIVSIEKINNTKKENITTDANDMFLFIPMKNNRMIEIFDKIEIANTGFEILIFISLSFPGEEKGVNLAGI
jgi:hypothetical protein